MSPLAEDFLEDGAVGAMAHRHADYERVLLKRSDFGRRIFGADLLQARVLGEPLDPFAARIDDGDLAL